MRTPSRDCFAEADLLLGDFQESLGTRGRRKQVRQLSLENLEQYENLEQLYRMLQVFDKKGYYALKSEQFIPDTKFFRTHDRSWESFEQVDFINDKARRELPDQTYILK